LARGRGGMRPTAPQNNPMNVSAVGGNGQNATASQAAQYIPQQKWGGASELMDIQQSAPMAAAPGIESSGMAMAPGTAAAPQEIIPLGSASQRPDEPITFGANAGPGPGMEALRLPNQTASSTIEILEQLLPYDETGEIAALYELALLRGI
jgi:hypothetical protein